MSAGMERLDQGARALGVAGLGPLDHLADEFGLQPVVLVEPALAGAAAASASASGRGMSLSLIARLLSGGLPRRRLPVVLGRLRLPCRYAAA